MTSDSAVCNLKQSTTDISAITITLLSLCIETSNYQTVKHIEYVYTDKFIYFLNPKVLYSWSISLHFLQKLSSNNDENFLIQLHAMSLLLNASSTLTAAYKNWQGTLNDCVDTTQNIQ